MNKTLRRSLEKARKERNKQCNMISCVCFIVLYKQFSYTLEQIMEYFSEATSVITESARQHKSVFEVFEEETGIELALQGDKSYHEYMFLSNDVRGRDLTDSEIIYMEYRSLKWTQALVLTALCLTLNRHEWNEENITALLASVDDIRSTIENTEEAYEQYMLKETGFKPEGLWK